MYKFDNCTYLAPDKKILIELLHKRGSGEATKENVKLVEHNLSIVYGYCPDYDSVLKFVKDLKTLTDFPYRDEEVGVEDLESES